MRAVLSKAQQELYKKYMLKGDSKQAHEILQYTETIDQIADELSGLFFECEKDSCR